MAVSLDQWRGRVDRTLEDHDTAIGKLDSRVGSLEKFMWKTLGAALIGSILGGGLVTVIAYLIVGALQHG